MIKLTRKTYGSRELNYIIDHYERFGKDKDFITNIKIHALAPRQYKQYTFSQLLRKVVYKLNAEGCGWMVSSGYGMENVIYAPRPIWDTDPDYYNEWLKRYHI